MKTRELATLANAIAARTLVTIEYDGDEFPRRVEPYIIYRSTSTGETLLDAYQLEGYTASKNKAGRRVGWRQFNLAKIRFVHRDSPINFNPRDSYNPDSARYETPLAQL